MEPPYRVLIVCTGNTCRSQMGEGLVNTLLKGRWEAFSAGTEPGQLNPRAVEVMAEVGIDISGHKVKSLQAFEGASFDLAVTLCDEAAQTCPRVPNVRYQVHLPIPDPAPYTYLPEDESLPHFRNARDLIREQLIPLLEEWAERLKVS